MKAKAGELFLFDDLSSAEGARNQHIVIIQSMDDKPLQTDNGTINTPRVVGYLQNQFSYDVASTWSPMLDGLVGGGLLTKVGQFTGSPLFQSGLFKRKFYKEGGDISFTVDLRIVSDASYTVAQQVDQGQILNPKTAAHWLASLCLPTTDPGVIEAVKHGVDAGYKLFMQSADEIAIATGKDEYLKKMQVERGKKFAENLMAAADKPYGRTVRVKIGNMFDSFDMIVESVSIKYSRESVYSGNAENNKSFDLSNTSRDAESRAETSSLNLLAYQPLYVDVSLKVTTRTVPTVDKKGNANTGLLTAQPWVSLASEIRDIVEGQG